LVVGALAALSLVAAAGSQASAQNLLANPGFEDPITYDGPPFVGSWEGFNQGPGSFAVNATVSPRTGLQHLDASIINTDNSFAGVFQDVPGMIPGQVGTFSGWHRTPSSPLDLDVEVRIEWRNSGTNTEISRNQILPLATAQYTEFSITAPVPPGADTARVVYAIQTFTGGPTNNGTLYVDDTSFVIPEPTSMAVLGLVGTTALVARRRRH
jgi:hypothetical protein